MAATVTTDVLIVGAGPAGASAAVFLGKYGISNLLISRHNSTARTPRAHITNQRTMEALRDAGLERDCMAHASSGDAIEHSFWLRSMTGEELARSYSWGNDPLRKGDHESASPCRMCDLPQTQLEPILVAEAARLGSQVRFGTELLSFEQQGEGVTALIRDRVTGDNMSVRARYMIGADGARSRIVEQLAIPLVGQHGMGTALNVLCEVDLGDYVAHRRASLYHTVQPGSSSWERAGTFRMVRPWDRWLVTLLAREDAGEAWPSEGEIDRRVRQVTGNPDVPMKILDVSEWAINDVIARHYSVGRVFCMGDAVHRHPPANGLGSNTCVQDAFNLAWKLALVLQNKAAPGLLDSFNAERQPVGRQIVARANKSLRLNRRVGELLADPSPTGSPAIFDTREGRQTLRAALRDLRYENHAHGVQMNRSYISDAVIPDGTPSPVFERDEELFYQPSTRPGAPLPHVWLGKRTPGPRVSSLDLAGKQRFALFIGPGGDAWRDAAQAAAKETGVDIAIISVGPHQDYQDLYGRWDALSEIAEDGCVLVRPDLYVGWRSAALTDDPLSALHRVLRGILGLDRKPPTLVER